MSGDIVVGVDGSPHAQRALRFAIEEAERRDATVTAVHAYRSVVYYPGMEFGYGTPPPKQKLEAEAMSRLLAALDAVPTQVPVDPVVVEGSPSGALLRAAEGADLLIVGSRGMGGFTGLLLGSTSQQVVTHAHCPVVVVPPEADDAT